MLRALFYLPRFARSLPPILLAIAVCLPAALVCVLPLPQVSRQTCYFAALTRSFIWCGSIYSLPWLTPRCCFARSGAATTATDSGCTCAATYSTCGQHGLYLFGSADAPPDFSGREKRQHSSQQPLPDHAARYLLLMPCGRHCTALACSVCGADLPDTSPTHHSPALLIIHLSNFGMCGRSCYGVPAMCYISSQIR